MSIDAVVLQEVIANGKKLARLEGEQDAYKAMGQSLMDLMKLATPVICTFIQADMQPNVNPLLERVERQFQSKTDRMEAQIKSLEKLVMDTIDNFKKDI